MTATALYLQARSHWSLPFLLLMQACCGYCKVFLHDNTRVFCMDKPECHEVAMRHSITHRQTCEEQNHKFCSGRIVCCNACRRSQNCP